MIYVYYCPSCENEEDHNHGMMEDPTIKCSKCSKVMKKKITGGTATIFKGSGWAGSAIKNDKYQLDAEKDKIKSGIKEDPYKKWRDEPL